MFKRFLVLMICSVFLMTSLSSEVMAKSSSSGKNNGVIAPFYLNLGDSIAYGMSADPGSSYFNLYDTHLQQGPSLNLAVPGATTSDLLKSMTTPDFQKAIKRADIITVSIGGNNLLKPVLQRIYSAYGLNMSLNSYTELQEAIALGGANKWAIVASTIITSATTLTSPIPVIPITLGDELRVGIGTFQADWQNLQLSLRKINPDATIVFLTLYNPFELLTLTGSPLIDPMITLNNQLYGTMAASIGVMNGQIKSSALLRDVYVADVDAAFSIKPEAVLFSLGIMNPATFNLDIHPSTLGHRIIADQMIALGDIRGFQPHSKGKIKF